ncbi:unnamed protein product [Brassicogethes aeneus]|uniref:Uncharacterized protein n=1 Tax=Brassicogethes aeneus TaxID=1431903 RepID=A0A9P0BKC4_BRAAE|nr:unnamed protein product [Brassicogethes aeneus]
MKKCINHMDADCIESIRSKVLATPKTRANLDFYSDECFSSYCGGGTCNVCVLASNGDAIAITSSINSAYGAMFASPSTGIILNNHMMDFNVAKDPLSLNDVEPEKQPLSSMSPTIILNKSTGLIRLVIGAAGGPKIITAVSQIILEHILYEVPLEEAMENRRLHHQLMPMKLFYEGGFPYVREMRDFGHEVEELRTININDLFIHLSSSASSIQLIDGVVKAFGDKRRHGSGATTQKTNDSV